MAHSVDLKRKDHSVRSHQRFSLMNLLSQIARVLVGSIFIFSGLIKLNDPVGTQIKLEEYFEVFATDFSALHGFFHFLIPYALPIAVFLCAAEVVLGVALLLAYRIRQTTWILLALVTFFTFLTFYSAYYNKVTDCGCFGEAIKLQPWQSFTKDVVLMVLILFLLFRRSDLRPLLPKRIGGWAVGLATVLSAGLGIYAIRHLPPVDMLPYRIGGSIPSQMKPSDTMRYLYKMEKNGQLFEFEKYPSDTTYVYKEMILLNPEAKPKITDYAVWNSEGDFTQQTFEGNRLIVVLYDVRKANLKSMEQVSALTNALEGSSVQPMALTASDETTFEAFRHEAQLGIPYYFADATVLKTIIRSNPGLVLLSNGTVKGKWHFNDVPSVEEVRNRLK
jgi:uncharacterized membrane protein YphA (DoxX/SURF4 family)